MVQPAAPDVPDVTPVIDCITDSRGTGLATQYQVRWRTDENSPMETSWEALSSLTDARVHIENDARSVGDMSHIGWPAVGTNVSAYWKGCKGHPAGWLTAKVVKHFPLRNNMQVRWDCDKLLTTVSQKQVRHLDALPVLCAPTKFVPSHRHMGSALNLCSGTGGEARGLAPYYDPVITVDKDTTWKPTYTEDVREFWKCFPRWYASYLIHYPPNNCFSGFRQCPGRRPPSSAEWHEAMAIVRAVLKIVDYLVWYNHAQLGLMTCYIIENPAINTGIYPPGYRNFWTGTLCLGDYILSLWFKDSEAYVLRYKHSPC